MRTPGACPAFFFLALEIGLDDCTDPNVGSFSAAWSSSGREQLLAFRPVERLVERAG
jgi:hypothetical protein